MKITGAMLIGQSELFAAAGTLRAFDPATGASLEPVFTASDEEHVDRACTLAAQAFDSYRETTLPARAAFLRRIGSGLLELGEELIARAHVETALPKARLTGERGRTIGQLEMFAKLVEGGRWIGATIDTAMPDRKPLPRVDLRLRKIALGPVAIFGASNFPLAFSVAGGDAASALAAGCPIVVKAHPAHPGTSELVGRVIQKAIADCGLHEGVFSLLTGAGNELGQALVMHPAIKAVGFTGSRAGGLSLMQAVASRPEPIPVYAEMSSVNPMFLLPAALKANAATIAKNFVDSMTLGVGQFCTNPGVVIAISDAAFEHFSAAAAAEVSARAPGTMLTADICAAYEKGIARLASSSHIKTIARASKAEGAALGTPALFSVDAKNILAHPELTEEVFGPSSVLVRCGSKQEMLDVSAQIEGQLTASIFAEAADFALAHELIPILEKKVGRIVFNGFPTGVEVGWAMVHGGPFPATTDSRTTSVGAGAIERFLRPVSYQDMPAALLPASLQDANPTHIPQTRDTKLQ